jgi:hypothetical protein
VTGAESTNDYDWTALDDNAADVDLPAIADTTLPNLYVGLEIDLLAPGDGIVTDRHHASAERYEADDPQNQIAGQISPFTLSGWLRHGCERVLHEAGVTACHPGEPDADYMLADTYERDLDAGYHEKGACVGHPSDTETGGGSATETHPQGCLLYDLFGGFGAQPGKLLRRPVSFSPIRRQVDVTDGEAEAHYRQLSTQVRSRNDADGGQPLRYATRDVVGNLVGTWLLTLRTIRPAFVGLLAAATDYLNANSDDYALQLGGARNFGAGMADVHLLNTLYTQAEIRRVYNRAQNPTATMTDKDDQWADQYRPAFDEALQQRLAARGGDLSTDRPSPTHARADGGDATDTADKDVDDEFDDVDGDDDTGAATTKSTGSDGGDGA